MSVSLVRGTSPQQLADDLGISVKTAAVQRSKALAKRVVRNDRGLYRIALDSGALDSLRMLSQRFVTPPESDVGGEFAGEADIGGRGQREQAFFRIVG